MNSKRLTRSIEDRMFAGVCGGIADYLEVDSTLVRLVFVALTLMGGPGIIIYIILMLIVPEATVETLKAKREAVNEHPDENDSSLVLSSIPVPPAEDDASRSTGAEASSES